MRAHTILIPALLVVCACTTKLASPVEYNASVITEDEIAGSGAVTAYDAIKKLHANFLSYRGPTTLNNTSSPEPTVYLDGQLFGLLPSLRQIPTTQIAEIRLYRSWEAQTKFGVGNMGGVIAITTRQ